MHSFGHRNYSHAAFLLVLRSQFLQGSSNLTESIGKGYRKNLRRTIATAIIKIYLEFQRFLVRERKKKVKKNTI